MLGEAMDLNRYLWRISAFGISRFQNIWHFQISVEEEPRSPAIPLSLSVPMRTSACSPPSHGTATWAQQHFPWEPIPASPSNRPILGGFCVLGMCQPPVPEN